MSESKEYVSQTLEHGAIHISEEVIAAIAALGKGIRLVISDDDEISVDCYIVVLYGHSVVDVAKAVQDAVTAAVESTTGRTVKSVNVSISGITLPRTAKK